MNRSEQLKYLNQALLSEMPQYREQAEASPGDEATRRRLLRALMNVRPPLPLSPGFLEVQDALLSAETEEKGVVDGNALPPVPSDPRLVLWQGDITRLRVDAIVDADNMMNLPKGVTRASGYDVLTHAVVAYVSIMASDYTDGFALTAIRNVFKYLPRAYKNGAKDPEARIKMADASCLAGIAFANAFLGVNHSLAHKLGGWHHIPHGTANALLFTEICKYNAQRTPTKMGTFSQYQYPHAKQRYVEAARYCGIQGKNDDEVFENFIQALEDLKEKIGIKKTIKDYGVDEKYFLDTLDEMVENAFNDQCTGANPRYPLMSEIKEIYLKCYYGK